MPVLLNEEVNTLSHVEPWLNELLRLNDEEEKMTDKQINWDYAGFI